jgi:hypothetical protein
MSETFSCALCGKGVSKKCKDKKPVYLPSMLYHMTRKQNRQLLQRFPLFRTDGLKAHPACVNIFIRFAQHHRFFSRYVACAICLEDILDNQDALIPRCNIVEHSLHKNCIDYDLNGCPMCRFSHLPYRDRLRHTRNRLSGWTVL